MKDVESKIENLVKEFKAVKDSIEPVLNEIKNMKEIKIEFNQMKKDMDVKLRRLDSEVRSLGKNVPNSKDISSLKDRLTRLSKDLDSIKSNKTGGINKETLSEELKGHSELQKANLTRIKNQLKEMDKTHLDLISANRTKAASIISEFNKLKDHDEQLTKELNSHKNAIFDLKSKIEKQLSQLETLVVMTSKIDKKQTTDIGDVKNRIYKLEKKMLTSKDINNIKKGVMELKEKVTGEVGYIKQRVKDIDNQEVKKNDKKIKELTTEFETLKNQILTKELNELKKEITGLKSHTLEVVKELDRINIKVNNTSKIITDMEKVL